ncbi:chalcone-flavanone isomerase family protein [Actinidia rufa]|uniref:Chalcone-flavanone isomerase family protein n=1 Tax=Actinidia rufa TaxID=165716 RepID=A0A7J0DW18_9ERIC|nr:chalcone-flavanone isomerase family protein [Actinidia rufa]
MSPLTPVTGVQIETVVFPPMAKSPGTAKPSSSAAQKASFPSLAVKWTGKTAQELTEFVEFFRHIF